MPLLESNYYGLWVGKQSAKGTPNTTPGKRLVQVAGDFGFTRDDGEELYSDLTKYPARTDWVNSLLGQGEPGVEATPTELAYLLWLFHGDEDVTAITGPPAASKHSFGPSVGLGHYFTAFVRVGNSVVRRHQFNDCLITKIVVEASTANKAVRVTPTVLSLDPGYVFASDPSAALPTDKSLLYTDGAGAFEIDGAVFRGQSQFTLTIDDAWTPIFSDDTNPFDLVQGTPSAGVGVTLYLDSDAHEWWNNLAYGDPTPAAGTPPLKVIPALGSYAAELTQADSAGDPNGLKFVADFPEIKWTLPPAIAPNPEGGTTEIPLAGSLRGGDYTLDVYTDDAVTAFTT